MADKEIKSKAKDTESRSWFIVCPNVRTNGVAGAGAEELKERTEQEICDYVVKKWSSATKQAACLYCRSAEGMEHLHIVLCSKSSVRFSTVKKFIGSGAHIEMTMGTKTQVEAYINKTGKFEEKGEVILAKAQEGELTGRQGKRTDIEIIREAIDEGMTWQAVVRLRDHFYQNRYISLIKAMYFDKRKQETPFKREIKVHWLVGESGSGKTGVIFELVEKYGEENIYLVSDYQNPFDGYAGEPVIILDEFRGQLSYATLLGMLEGYKKEMHCRYANVLGLWNEVYITTIKTPEEVYTKMIEKDESESDPISQLLSRISDVSYCYRVNRADGTKTDRNGQPAEFLRYTTKNYRLLKVDKEKKTRLPELKFFAKLDYEMRKGKKGDTVEAFGVSPESEETEGKTEEKSG